MNDVRKVIYATIIGFFLMLAFWLSIIYISACGLTFTCRQAVPDVDRTPIPTLIPKSHSDAQMEMNVTEFNKCETTAMDLIGAWVTAGASESEMFTFTDANGRSCDGMFADDVQPLFVENSIWRVGEIGCVSCHNAASDDKNGGLDMASYNAISASGILGNGDWEKSRLYEVLSLGLVLQGHSADVSASNPVIFAGAAVPETEAAP